MGVIAGRVGEIERQENERIGAIQRDRQYITEQLKVKNDAVNTLMKLRGEDYDSAVKNYDSEFKKNLDITNLLRNINQDELTREDKLQDNARATLTTVYNSVTSGGLDPSKLSAQQKLDLQKLETQAGFPSGVIQTLYDKNPKSDIVFSTKGTETDGNDYLQMVVKDRDSGALKTEKFLLGKSADYQLKQQAAATAAAKKKTGGGGGGSTSTSAANKDKAKKDAVVNSVLTDLASLKKTESSMTHDEAHDYLYTKYANKLKTVNGLSDAQAKQALDSVLGDFGK